MNNPYRIEVVGKGENGKSIYGIVYKDPTYRLVGFPQSWGSRQHAVNALKDMLGIPHSEKLPS